MAKKYIGAGVFLFLMLTLLVGCKEDDSPVAPVTSNSVVGTWVDESGEEYIFNSNGTITGSVVDALNAILALAGEPAQAWTYNATHILINGQAASPYTVNGNKLSMKDEDGNNVVLTKK